MHNRNDEVVDCGRKADITFRPCLVCGRRVAVHCPSCSVAVTGCVCTLRKKQEIVTPGDLH